MMSCRTLVYWMQAEGWQNAASIGISKDMTRTVHGSDQDHEWK